MRLTQPRLPSPAEHFMIRSFHHTAMNLGGRHLHLEDIGIRTRNKTSCFQVWHRKTDVRINPYRVLQVFPPLSATCLYLWTFANQTCRRLPQKQDWLKVCPHVSPIYNGVDSCPHTPASWKCLSYSRDDDPLLRAIAFHPDKLPKPDGMLGDVQTFSR
ncbi:uncharacterized protein LOC142238929 isoform X2 [Haematobia irritans]|uniref:uncharacterized protein LOC142238929 isoform X2 n=1 Tax=Haematobia irritans TaxID=7368 RepID=UPI003F5088BC